MNVGEIVHTCTCYKHVHTYTHSPTQLLIKVNIIVCKLIDSNAGFIFYLGQFFFITQGNWRMRI